MHDLQLAQDLLAHRRLRVDEDDLPAPSTNTVSVCLGKGQRQAERLRYLLSHNCVRRDVLYLLHTPAIALPKLVQVLEVLVAQVVLDLRVHVEAGERVRERRVVCHALLVHRRVRAGGRRRWGLCDGKQPVDRGIPRGHVGGPLGLEVHGRRPLFAPGRLSRRRQTCGDRFHLGGLGLWGGYFELERLEIALGTDAAH